jgi:tetratricopeptide (TPR) repeat protein
MTRGKTLAAKIALAVLSPLVALAFAEGTLRLARIGLPVRFLVPVSIEGRPCWGDNPFYGYRFFPPELARNPSPIAMEREKPAGRVRIAVLGESAAQGDPLLEFGLPRMLEKMLGEMAGDDRYEVVNAAMTAINSPVIADIARDLQACRPDVVVLYIGNNEVVGPFGPGTIFSPLAGATRLAALRVRLTRLRLAQLLQFRRPKSPQAWAGLDMFSGLRFPEGDPRLEPMYRAYRRNLESIVAACRKGGARVLLSTVAVNLADCAPFGSEVPETLTPEARDEWQAEFEKGDAARDRGDLFSARDAYGQALALFGRHAGLVHRLAQTELAVGDRDAARDHFRRARDLDTQRFRADGRINEIIRAVAREKNVELVDADAAFDAASPERGVPGEELFLDHVHFTFEGTWRLAGLFAAVLRGAPPGEIPAPEICRRQMFFTPWAERQQAAAMRERRARPPLKGQPGNDRQIARLYETEARCAARIAETPLGDVEQEFRQLSEAAPRDFFLPFRWGSILAEKGRWAEALPPLTNALRQVPHHFEARALPAIALCQVGRPEDAARIVVGAPSPRGRYLAENAMSVLRALEAAGRLDEARRFRTELLKTAPRFPLRRAIETYPLGRPKS